MKQLYVLIVFAFLLLVGCTTVPEGLLRPSEDYLEMRQLQMRKYDTTEQEMIMSSVVGVLQDLGFTLDESESELGLIVASKKADAKKPAAVAGALFLDILSAIGDGYSGTSSTGPSLTSQQDATQLVRASVITQNSLDGDKIVVRANFHRIVYNFNNEINKMETIKEPDIYQNFYDKLSKAIFLEAHKI